MRIIPVDHNCGVCPYCTGELTDAWWCRNCVAHRHPDEVTCGGCERSWCERCQPAPSAMCVWCNGSGVDENARMSVDLDDPDDVIAFLGGGHREADRAQAAG